MKHTIRILLPAMLWAAMSSCQLRQEPADERPVVSVSIPPLHYMVDRLTGDALEVNVMVPPGASHGTYSPTPRQYQRLSDSGLYLMVGHLGYEQSFVHRLPEINPGMLLITLSDHVDLIRGEEIDHGDHVHKGGIDPHIWMSPAVMRQLLPVMRDALMEVYPDLEPRIREREAILAEEVERLHALFAGLETRISRHRFLIFHPALTYLARDYGLEQISIEHGGREPSPAMLRNLIRTARAEDIPVIFIQEEYDMRNAQLISEETGARLVQINPMDYDWVEQMQSLYDILISEFQ